MQRARPGDAGGLRRDIAAAALRTRRSLQEARDHHVFALDPLVCARGLGVGHCPSRF